MPNEYPEIRRLMAIIKDDPWYLKIWKPHQERYTLHEQLNAVRLPAEAGTKKALNFLQSAYTSTEREESTWAMSGSGDLPMETGRVRYYEYKNVREPLRSALNYSVTLITGHYGSDVRSPDEVRGKEEQICAQSQAHQILRDAIVRLKANIMG